MAEPAWNYLGKLICITLGHLAGREDVAVYWFLKCKSSYSGRRKAAVRETHQIKLEIKIFIHVWTIIFRNLTTQLVVTNQFYEWNNLEVREINVQIKLRKY